MYAGIASILEMAFQIHISKWYVCQYGIDSRTVHTIFIYLLFDSLIAIRQNLCYTNLQLVIRICNSAIRFIIKTKATFSREDKSYRDSLGQHSSQCCDNTTVQFPHDDYHDYYHCYHGDLKISILRGQTLSFQRTQMLKLICKESLH